MDGETRALIEREREKLRAEEREWKAGMMRGWLAAEGWERRQQADGTWVWVDRPDIWDAVHTGEQDRQAGADESKAETETERQ